MRAILSGNENGAIGGHGTSAATATSDGKSAVDDGEWFAKAARQLLPHKAGTILFLSTGLGDERLCQRYAAGQVKPPAYFLRALLRSEHGWQWLCAVMDGSGAEWFSELQRAQKISAAIEQANR